jgi:hypothetical protein
LARRNLSQSFPALVPPLCARQPVGLGLISTTNRARDEIHRVTAEAGAGHAYSCLGWSACCCRITDCHLSPCGKRIWLVAAFVRSTTPSGVDLFFVLSGVVLAPRHIREDRPLFACDYFRRRAQRLWPPYVFAWLLAGITIAITTAWPTWWSKSAYLPSFKAETWLGQAFIINWWSVNSRLDELLPWAYPMLPALRDVA